MFDVVLNESICKQEVRDSSGSALSIDRRGRSKTKGQSQHARSKSKNQGKSPNRSNVTCWNYGERGHFRTSYIKPKEETESEIKR